jgi:hypothetical protein
MRESDFPIAEIGRTVWSDNVYEPSDVSNSLCIRDVLTFKKLTKPNARTASFWLMRCKRMHAYGFPKGPPCKSVKCRLILLFATRLAAETLQCIEESLRLAVEVDTSFAQRQGC